MSDENEVTAQAFWEAVHSRPTIIGPRTSTRPPTPAEPPAEPEGPDVAGLSLDEFGQQREQLGIRQVNTDVFGADSSDPGGLPDWRHPVMYEEIEFSELDRARDDRPAASVNSSDFMGVPARTPRSAVSPWRVV